MITATEDILSRPEEESVKSWLLNPACDLFLTSLSDEQTLLEIKALATISTHHHSVLHEDKLPPSAVIDFRKAQELALVIRTLREKTSPNAVLYRTRLSTTV